MSSQLFVLEPKYLACRPAGSSISPLGSILVADITGESGVVAAVEAAHRGAVEPWCPVVLVSRSADLSHPVAAVVDQFNLAPAIVTLPGEANLLGPDAIVTAVKRRKPASPDRLARYVATRTERPDVCIPLTECFRRGMSDGKDPDNYSRSTLNRRLAGFGPLKPRAWRGLARALSLLLASGSLRLLCKTHGIDPRTVQAHIHRFTGLDFGRARQRPGWEWVMEAGLRRAGYLENDLGPPEWRIGQSG